MKIKGKLTKKMDVIKGTSKNGKQWEKIDFLIHTGAEYNPEVCLQCFGEEKVSKISNLIEGVEYEFSININSREYKGKYYTNIDCWKVENVTVEETNETPF